MCCIFATSPLAWHLSSLRLLRPPLPLFRRHGYSLTIRPPPCIAMVCLVASVALWQDEPAASLRCMRGPQGPM